MKVLLIIALFSSCLFAETILIDPGHGGTDTGAKKRVYYYKNKKKKSYIVYEKNINLQIAKRIQKYLTKKHTVYLTRSYDRTVSLAERANLADKVKADLFISVHANSSSSSLSNGFETYYLDNRDGVALKKAASAEKHHNHGFGDNITLQKILIDLVVSKTVKTSTRLAKLINSKLSRNLKKFKIKNRGVKPGLFYVLALAKRPGVLLESGFISNKKELKKLRRADFQEAYAKSVAGAINDYLKKKTKSPSLF